jgi:Glycosyl transferase family 90
MKIKTSQRIRRVIYYSKGISQQLLVPNRCFRARLEKKLAWISNYDRASVLDRVNYYNKIHETSGLSKHAIRLGAISSREATLYYYDYRSVMRHFHPDVRAEYKFGDAKRVLDRPAFVKSRPVGWENGNNILLKMDSVRHFYPIRDRIPYEEKQNQVVWRGAAWQTHRREFLRRYWNHPLCDVGQINHLPFGNAPKDWVKPRMSIPDQLCYKFILSIEGNDVASNLKWIGQSNSLCFMTRPKFESWFMEGRLVASEHYVELREDYADLPEKIEHYITHPHEAKQIIENLHARYHTFTDPRLEELVSLLVVMKYLRNTGQLL